MQPTRLRRVVFPEPLGPLKTVTWWGSICRLTSLDRGKLIGLPRVKDLPDIDQFNHRFTPS